MFTIYVTACLWFIYYFWKINFIYGVYIVAFFLSLILVLSLFSDNWKNNWKEFIKYFFLEYIMYINFIVIAVGVYFILKYFVGLYDHGLMVDVKVSVIIMSIISFISLLAVVLNKKELLKVTSLWLFIIWSILYILIKDIKIFYYFISYISALAVVWHLLYYTIYNKYNKYLLYVIFIFTLTTFFILTKQYFISSTIIFSFTIQVVIFLILYAIIYVKNTYWKIEKLKNKLKEREKELKLFGFSDIELEKEEKEYLKKQKKYKTIYEFIIDFFIKSPKLVKILFSLTNTIPIIIASYTFFHQLESVSRLQNEIYYWLGALMYFVNFLLFKKLHWFVVIQRLFAFFVINFVTYFTIIDFSWKNFLYIALWWIIWNLFATIVILFLDKKHNTFDTIDYLIWSLVNFIWVFVNIYFLFKINLNYYLSIWIALLYLGLYLYLYRIVYKKVFL